MKRVLERLAHSDMFEADIRTRLLARGFEAGTVERVVVALRDRGFINEVRAAESFVSQRSGKKARGESALASELKKRGAPDHVIGHALETLSPERKLEDMAAILKARCKPLDSRAKGARLLLSRGFEEDEIASALDAFFGPDDSA